MKTLLAILTVLVVALAASAQSGPPEDAKAHVGAAVRLLQDRRYSDAAAEFERALAIQPNDDAVRIQYATCLFVQERDDEARRQFEIERRRLGDKPGLTYYLGRLDLRANDFNAAIDKLAPLESNAAFSKVSLYLGLAYMAAAQPARALECLERAARNNPRDPEVHYRLARLYTVAGRANDADREYKLYRDCVEDQRVAEKDSRECADALQTQSLAQARIACQRLADPPDSRHLILLGQLYSDHGAFAEAVVPFQEAARLAPEAFDAWYGLGSSLFRLKRYQEALRPLRKATDLNPQFLDTLTLLASTLHALGDDAAALPVLERAHSLNPGDAKMTAVLEQLRIKLRQKQ